MKAESHQLSLLVLSVLGLALAGPAGGGGFGSAQALETWVSAGMVSSEAVERIPFQAQVLENREFVLDGTRRITGLAVHGEGILNDSRSGIRIVLVDGDLREYLVAEAYPLLTGEGPVVLHGVCRETCVMEPISPFRLKVLVENASLRISGLDAVLAGTSDVQGEAVLTEIAATQAREIVAQLNTSIDRFNLGWVAGETQWSRLTYETRHRRSQLADPPISHGIEYYVGGTYAVPTETARREENGGPEILDSGGSIPIVSFDWRRKHDADRPGSPYYDGDITGGGWMTPVRRQACSDCWAHATVAMVEALINLSANRHVDADLAEQDLLSCSGAGTCAGGRVSLALDYLSREGVTSESCFPYAGMDMVCGYSCEHPSTRAFAGEWEEILFGFSEVAIKEALVRLGPLVLGIRSQWHLVLLVGYDRDAADGHVVWIIKNSWGEDWGEAGYGLLKLPVSEFYAVFGLRSVTLYEDGREVTNVCRDADHDGYSAWGFGMARPAGCFTIGGVQDCNDSNPNLGPVGSDGNCELINAPPDEPIVPANVSTGSGGGGSAGVVVLLGAGLIAVVTWIDRALHRS